MEQERELTKEELEQRLMMAERNLERQIKINDKLKASIGNKEAELANMAVGYEEMTDHAVRLEDELKAYRQAETEKESEPKNRNERRQKERQERLEKANRSQAAQKDKTEKERS